MVADRDQRFDVSSERKREQRSDIEYPPIDPEADAWQKGIVPQLELTVKSGGAGADRSTASLIEDGAAA